MAEHTPLLIEYGPQFITALLFFSAGMHAVHFAKTKSIFAIVIATVEAGAGFLLLLFLLLPK